MLNLFSKTTPWMVASLLVATAGFGQDNRCCPAPKPKPQCCEPVKCEKVCPPVCPVVLNPAYNQSAMIDTRCSWDVWADASFTYWQAIQDNMEIGFADTETDALLIGSALSDAHVIDTGFKYKPGFKVGFGIKFDHDDWDSHLGYTWFRSTVNTSSNGPGSTATSFGTILPTLGFPGLLGGATEVNFDTVSSKWRCNMDILDAVMGRWYYVGTKLQFHPYAGARGQWIRQKLNTTYDVVAGSTNNGGTAANYNNSQNTNSWAVGPEMGLDVNWNIGEGFRLYSGAEVDVLFTRYTKARVTDTYNDDGSISVWHVSQKKMNRVRSHIDMEMGLGWGTFLDCNNWYLDLYAGYGFQVFFDQNMFRFYADDFMRAKSFVPNGNLYVQGMTATVSLHF